MSEQIISTPAPPSIPESLGQLSLPIVVDVSNNLSSKAEEINHAINEVEPNTPPTLIARNKCGLLINEKYFFDEKGFVDYKKMVDTKFLYLNPDVRRRTKIEAKYGKKFEEIKPIDDKVDDTDLVIQLGGLKHLLRLRGYNDLNYIVNESNESYASVTCRISFIPNYETENRPMDFADNACAHANNTTNFGKQYLLEIATNRALCRCIRNFLGINIVAQEELGINGLPSEGQEDMAVLTLKNVMNTYGITFEKIKAKLIEEKFENAASFKEVSDIPKIKIFNLIERIKSKAAEKEAK